MFWVFYFVLCCWGILVVATWFGCGGVGLGCLVWDGDLVFIWCVGFLFTLVWVGGDVGLGGFWFAVVVNASLGGFGGLLRLGFIYYGCDDSLWRSAVFGFGLLFGVGGDC